MREPDYHLSGTQLPEGREGVDLWVTDGRISTSPLVAAEELEPGGFILPGLVDCHSHLTMNFSDKPLEWGSPELVESNLADHLAAGELLIRDIGAVSDATSPSALPGGGGPRTQLAGRFLAPPGGYFEGYAIESPADQAPEIAAAQIRAGGRWVKVIGDWPHQSERLSLNYSPETLAAIVAAVHGEGGRVGIHALARQTVEMAVAAGVDTIEHGPGIDEELAATMTARRIAWTPTLAFLDGVLLPHADRFPPAFAAEVAPAVENARSVLPKVAALGLYVLAGTDAIPHGSVWLEVAALHAYGMEPADALAAATTSAREFLGEPAISDGAPADIVVYPVDPRNDPEVLRTPSAVLFGGRRIR
jgi:imidazolonepropionase-like amidohydrolase